MFGDFANPFNRVIQAFVSSGKPRKGLTDYVLDAQSLRRQRLHLGSLDERLLDDIGLTRDQADGEVKRPAWDVPNHWRR